MPVMDGPTATVNIIKIFEKFMEMPENQENSFDVTLTPIVALTANFTQADKEICLESGMTEFLSKPFEMQDLIRILSDVFGDDM